MIKALRIFSKSLLSKLWCVDNKRGIAMARNIFGLENKKLGELIDESNNPSGYRTKNKSPYRLDILSFLFFL